VATWDLGRCKEWTCRRKDKEGITQGESRREKDEGSQGSLTLIKKTM
jgi:hypothetical protein